MVLYALVSNTSIGALFLAGIVPGLMMGVVLMAMNGYMAHKRGFALEEPVPLGSCRARRPTPSRRS
jgi:TRAP-type C4-dicarboxylate transport system permease large subunit